MKHLIVVALFAACSFAQERVGPPEIYPNPETQPGATNAAITQANIARTICSKKWSTKSIRPSSSYTTKLKKEQMVAYGDTVPDPKKSCIPNSDNPGCYEEDHLVSLENGGNPTDPRNLWPEPYFFYVGKELAGAKQKDAAEQWIHDAICFDIPDSRHGSKYKPKASITLEHGQAILTGDWYACYLTLLSGDDCK